MTCGIDVILQIKPQQVDRIESRNDTSAVLRSGRRGGIHGMRRALISRMETGASML